MWFMKRVRKLIGTPSQLNTYAVLNLSAWGDCGTIVKINEGSWGEAYCFRGLVKLK